MNERDVTPEMLDVLRSMELFQGKDTDQLTEWLGKSPFEGAAECELREFAAQERIFTQGTFGNSLYILIRGSVGIALMADDRLLATLRKGSFFGEMTLISGLPRSANVTALEPCLAIEVPRRAFEQWMKKPGPFRDTMDRAYIERGLSNHLRMIPEFSQIEPRILQELAKGAKLRIFSKDEAIVREGEEADSLFLIREGYVRVVKRMAGSEQRTVAYLEDGAYFGEYALLRAERRNASVLAMGKVEAIELKKEAFLALLSGNQHLSESVLQLDKKRREDGGASAATPLGFVGEVVERGVVKATSALVIHLNDCTRCGNCVKACAELHDGISRLTRHGMLFEAPGRGGPKSPLEPFLVATSCMHCLDPECMIGCPTGAITRDVNGEVIIQNSCIGCGNCARRCPYGNISMADARAREELEKQDTGAPVIGAYLKFWRTSEDKPMLHEMEPGEQVAAVRRIAVKCDLCRDYNYNHGCVHNCPYGAIERTDAAAFLDQLESVQ